MQNRMQGIRRLTLEEREQLKIKKLSFKDKYEMRLRGDYERIYPLPDEELTGKKLEQQSQYDFLIAASKEVWGEQTSGGGVNAKKRIEELDKKFHTPVVIKAIQTPNITKHIPSTKLADKPAHSTIDNKTFQVLPNQQNPSIQSRLSNFSNQFLQPPQKP